MLETVELSEAQWQVADAIARQLVIDGTDVNELRKAIAYLREHLDRDGAGRKFFDYLKVLVRSGDSIGHSRRTSDYYRSLDAVCSQYLSSYQEDAPKMLLLLSWAARLVFYYKSPLIGEVKPVLIKSEREAEIQAAVADKQLSVGQVLDAVVTSVKGGKVTYELLGAIRLTQKEPKKAQELREGQSIKVQIDQLREDGAIKRVKAAD